MFITIKGYIKLAKGRKYRAESGKVPNVKFPLSSGMCYSTGIDVWQKTCRTDNLRSLPEFWCPEFLLGLYYMID